MRGVNSHPSLARHAWNETQNQLHARGSLRLGNELDLDLRMVVSLVRRRDEWYHGQIRLGSAHRLPPAALPPRFLENHLAAATVTSIQCAAANASSTPFFSRTISSSLATPIESIRRRVEPAAGGRGCNTTWMAKDNKEGLTIYESHPPPWLPKTHHSADLGTCPELSRLT